MNYYGGTNMAHSWRTVRNNTIQVAEEIPADQYNYRATNDTMTVAELLAHMATNTGWGVKLNLVDKPRSVSMEDFGRYIGESRGIAASLTTKDAIVAALKTNGEELARGLESVSDETLSEMVELPGGSKSRFEMLLGLKEHEMHHRGQLMVIQRLLGLVPHLTRARQERMAAQAAAAAR